MTLALTQSATAVGAGIQASFLASGGTAPYTYAVAPGGAGGNINASTGVYVAPAALSSDPAQAMDTITVTDAASATASVTILAGTPLLLFCDIIQTGLGLAAGRVYLWNQKIKQPTDDGLYVAISVPRVKPFGTNRSLDGSGNEVQTVNMGATVEIDVISRDAEARDRKEEVVMAFSSAYSRRQQGANSFFVAPQSHAFNDLSHVDGAAIPYRYKIAVNLMYLATKTTAQPFFDTVQVGAYVDQGKGTDITPVDIDTTEAP